MRKVISKFFVLICTLGILATYTHTVYAKKPGDIVDYVLYTDIVTYIDNEPIKSYNINGYTVVVSEDLVDYGFDFYWNEQDRAVHINRILYSNANKSYHSSYVPEKNTHVVGTRAMPVLYTDIKVYFEGELIRSHNINGKTVIYVDDIAKLCASSYKWLEQNRTLNLKVIPNWACEVTNLEYDSMTNELMEGFAFSIENKSNNNEIVFKIKDYAGDFKAIGGFGLNSKSISFSIYQNVNKTGDFFHDINNNINIKYNERVAEDTPERREALSKVFRVYINDELLTGELSYTQGNGHGDYTFLFDKLYDFNDIKTMKLEIGNITLKN